MKAEIRRGLMGLMGLMGRMGGMAGRAVGAIWGLGGMNVPRGGPQRSVPVRERAREALWEKVKG